jgi:autotransporter-associated beta strand protein
MPLSPTSANDFITFEGTSSAGSATITTDSGSTINFTGASTGSQARFIVNSGGVFDMSALTTAGMTAGSIEGAGTYNLGSKELIVGLNDLSTQVSGVIADGGASGGTGGSIVKVGTGTLTLLGTNTYSGGTSFIGGVLAIERDANLGTGRSVLTAAPSKHWRLEGGSLQPKRSRSTPSAALFWPMPVPPRCLVD